MLFCKAGKLLYYFELKNKEKKERRYPVVSCIRFPVRTYLAK